MHIVKSVGVLSVAKILGLIYGCMGLIFAPFFLLIGLLGTVAGKQSSPFAGMFGIGFAIFMPIIYGAMGFISGALGALLYNLFARLVGGFELRLEVKAEGLVASYLGIPSTTPASNS